MTSTPPRAGGGRALVGIGEVMALLRPEFPDVSVSKIRFLEAEGLVEPQRTPSGYRKFGPSDLDRLRYVLRAQRDQYLPLKVIKDHLDAIDRGLEPTEDGLGAALAAADASPPAPVYFTREELLAAAGIDDAALTRLEEFGLIEARRVVAAPGTDASRGSDRAMARLEDPATSDGAAPPASGLGGVPAARGSDVGAAGARAFEPRRAADAAGGGDAAAGDSATVRTAGAPVGDAAVAVDVLSAQVLDAQRGGAAGSSAAAAADSVPDEGAAAGPVGPRGAADAASEEAADAARTTIADPLPGDVTSADAAASVGPVGARAAASAGSHAAACDAGSADAQAPSDDMVDVVKGSGDEAHDAAAPAGHTNAPPTAPVASESALTAPGQPDSATAAPQTPEADAADTGATTAPDTAETPAGGPRDAAADVPGEGRDGGSAAPEGSPADAGVQVQDGAPGASQGSAADTRAQEQPSPDRQPLGTTAGETTSSSAAPERPVTGGSTAPQPTAAQPGGPTSPGSRPAARPAAARPTATDADAAPRTVLRYDGDALVVARLVTALGEYGLEPRHLRQVKAAADREAALAEQIVAPLLHRRGAGAKSGAEETVRDLLSLTSRLHTVLVSAALRPLLDR